MRSAVVAMMLALTLQICSDTASGDSGGQLVLELKMDEGQGLVAKDTSGFNNNGRIKNAEWIPGDPGGALNFREKGTVEIRDSAALRLAGNMTIDFRMKGRPTGTIVSKYSPGDNQRSFIVYFSKDRLTFQINANGMDTPEYWERLKDPLSEDAWHHITVSVHDIRGADKIRMLVDGVEMATDAHLGGEPFTAIHAGAAPLVIGPYAGAIDELRIYNDHIMPAGTGPERSQWTAKQYAGLPPIVTDVNSGSGQAPFGFFEHAIGGHRQLFVDDYLVLKTEDVTRRLHQPRKYEGNPVLKATLPYETTSVCLQGSVLFDSKDGLFKAFYSSDLPGLLYATSRDGTNWEKPLLDLFPVDGQKTNIVYRGTHPDLTANREWDAKSFAVMLDDGDPDPERRFKLFSFELPTSRKSRETYPDGRGYYGAVSPNGIRWKPVGQLVSIADDPHLSDAVSCMYDNYRNRYIAFTKRHQNVPHGIGDQDGMFRVRGIAFSSDFKKWTRPANCLIPDDKDPRDMQFYRQTGFTYEGMYLGFVEAYYSDYENPDKPLMRDIQLTSSRDGELWWRAGNRDIFIPLGARKSDWDCGLLDANSAGPTLVGNELWFFYGGRSYPHESNSEIFPRGGGYRYNKAVGLAKLRRDGFVSYDAGGKPGTILTKIIRFGRGKALHVNADCGPQGYVQTEIVDIFERTGISGRNPVWKLGYGSPAAGFSLAEAKRIEGDCIDATVTWEGNTEISSFAGKPIAIRFVLKNASLYSWWIE